MALVLAGTFTFAPIGLAEENTSEYETVDIQSTENLNTTVSPEEIEDAKTEVDELEETNPSLIPGDFFYFAKITLEKIRLAFTFDNAKEAELLATYAAERLAEAGALFAEGKEDEALKVIEDAVIYMENSQEIIDEESLNDDVIAEGTEAEDGAEDAADSEVDEGTEEVAPADDVLTEEAAIAEDPLQEIENVLRQNIIALTAAMEKVKNPAAKAALQKNIDKTYAKMAKKLAKLEGKYGIQPEEAETTEPVELEPVVESDLQPADDLSEVVAEETMPEDDNIAVPAVAPAKGKQQAKHQQKVEKADDKQGRKAAKQEAKQGKKEINSQHKQEGKKSQKQADHGKGKGKQND